MKRTFYTLLLLFISITFINCQNYTSIESYIKKLVADDDFVGNVLVVKNGKTLYEASFGFADTAKTIPLTKDYRFGIGSVYKEFPAVSIMQLQEKGLLKVDDKINTYLKDLPNWSSKISIKNLLQYTSGLPKIAWEKYLESNELITYDKIKNDLLNLKKLEYEPGKDYIYTNYSPILLSKIVEAITKQSFTDYVTQNLFNPFALNGAVMPAEVPF